MGIPGRQNGVGKTLGWEGAWRLCAPAGSRGAAEKSGCRVCVSGTIGRVARNEI